MKFKNSFLITFGIVFLVMVLGLVLGVAPTWQGSNVNYTTSEGTVYNHNLSGNITGYNSDVTFAIDTTLEILSRLSLIEQLIFFLEKLSDAAANTDMFLTPAANALSNPCSLGTKT